MSVIIGVLITFLVVILVLYLIQHALPLDVSRQADRHRS